MSTRIECPVGFPQLRPMASGGEALVLQPCALGQFRAAAEGWIGQLGLTRTAQTSSAEMGVALISVTYRGGTFWLAADEWLNELALEPQKPEFTALMRELFVQLGGAEDGVPSN